jgi:hypothetical protein
MYHSSSSGTRDSGCDYTNPPENDIRTTTGYVPFAIQSSQAQGNIGDQYYGDEEQRRDTRTGDTRYHGERPSESYLLQGLKEDPISEESAYVSDTSLLNRNQLPSTSCEECQPLMDQTRHNAHESDDDSSDNVRYSIGDISAVLDRSGSTVPDYVLSTSNSACNSKMPKSVETFIEVEGYVSMETDS